MMGFHSGQMSSLNLNIPWERSLKSVMHCVCGYSSKYGNKIGTSLKLLGIILLKYLWKKVKFNFFVLFFLNSQGNKIGTLLGTILQKHLSKMQS